MFKNTVLALCGLFVGLIGCGNAEVGHRAEEIPTVTWEAFLESSTKSFEGKTIYVVEGDIAVEFDELRAYYDRMIAEIRRYNEEIRYGVAHTVLPSTVNRVSGADDVWSPSQANNLTYCVSNEFGSDKALMVDAMAGAAADLEAAGDFDFIYDPSQDGNCRRSQTSTLFSVRPWNSGGACAFFPSGGGCVLRTVVIDVGDFTSGSVSVRGVLRHELGHTLGLRHEHIRNPNASGRCSEGTSWRGVTAYDSDSMMHYKSCPGSTNSGDLEVTALDAAGLGELYGGGGGGPPPDPNSCEGQCGGQAPGGCWCDSQCARFGDCCPDKVAVCG